MNTLITRIEKALDSRRGAITFVGTRGSDRVEWARLYEQAARVAAALQSRGVGPGAHVAFLGSTSRELVTAIEATWLAGATVMMLPLPARLGSLQEFVGQTRARIIAADVSLVVVDPDFAPFLAAQPGDPPVVLLPELAGIPTGWSYERPKDDPSSLAVLQFTSGSTSEPKGVMLPHQTIVCDLDGACAAAEFDPDENLIVSWLPLYHDMGLIGLLTIPLITGTDLVLAAPQDFLASPRRWLEWMSAFGGTATAAPDFAYALATRALRRSSGLDLSRWRIALSGAEPVDPKAVGAFCAAGAPHGLDPRVMFPAFGMAELAIAGTFPPPFRGLVLDSIDRRVLETEGYAVPVPPGSPGVRQLARLGRPIEGLEMRIVDPQTAQVRKEREVGELEVRGSAVTPGYYHNPIATEAAFRGEWLRTGDLAYIVEGELVVCGRIKDVIIVGGRNVFPEDVERAAGAVAGVRAGNVIAFGIEGRRGREAVVVVAETKADPAKLNGRTPDLRRRLAQRVREAVGLPPEEVVLVPPGTIPKTSSGKLQRSLCRSRYLSSELRPM